MKATIERLGERCPYHGRVRVVCPMCAGKAGGRAKSGRGHTAPLRAGKQQVSYRLWGDNQRLVPATILPMNALQGIIRHLKQERAHIDAALTALATLSTTFAPRTHKRN